MRPSFSGDYRSCGSAAPDLALVEVVGGLTDPTFVTSDPNDASRLFVLEQDGAVNLVVNGTKKTIATVQVNNPPSRDGRQERGLMSMAFHPRFGAGGEKRVYLSYTDGDGQNGATTHSSLNVAEFVLDGDTLDVGNPKPFLSVQHPNGANRHFGSMIAFGPDGYLYLSSGDGEGNDGPKYGQDKTAVLSAMLRVDVENPQTPPPGNIQDGDPRVLHKGFRNPWRFSFDIGNGDLFIGDVGANNEEINYVKAGTGPSNFHWPADNQEGALFAYSTVKGNGERGAVVGGYVYRGKEMKDMQGRYVFGDFDRGDIFALTYDGTKVCDQRTVWDGPKGAPVAFGQDAKGELLVLSYSSGSGPDSLYRLRQK